MAGDVAQAALGCRLLASHPSRPPVSPLSRSRAETRAETRYRVSATPPSPSPASAPQPGSPASAGSPRRAAGPSRAAAPAAALRVTGATVAPARNSERMAAMPESPSDSEETTRMDIRVNPAIGTRMRRLGYPSQSETHGDTFDGGQSAIGAGRQHKGRSLKSAPAHGPGRQLVSSGPALVARAGQRVRRYWAC